MGVANWMDARGKSTCTMTSRLSCLISQTLFSSALGRLSVLMAVKNNDKTTEGMGASFLLLRTSAAIGSRGEYMHSQVHAYLHLEPEVRKCPTYPRSPAGWPVLEGRCERFLHRTSLKCSPNFSRPEMYEVSRSYQPKMLRFAEQGASKSLFL